jgi:two-component system response regulator PilR (NtrC family)
LCDGKTITVDDLMTENKFGMDHGQKPSYTQDASQSLSLSDYLEDIEKRAIINALSKANNNKTAAAKLLGVSFRTLRYRLSKLGLAKNDDAELDNEFEDETSDTKPD